MLSVQVALPDLLHFLYKNRSSSQFTCPEFCYPYQSHMEQRRLFTRYSEFHDRMHSSSAAAKILYVTGDCESILGWVSALNISDIFGVPNGFQFLGHYRVRTLRCF